MWLLFCKCYLIGLGLMLGIETALGLCIAFGGISGGDSNDGNK